MQFAEKGATLAGTAFRDENQLAMDATTSI
jgi:hypothetical protein